MTRVLTIGFSAASGQTRVFSTFARPALQHDYRDADTNAVVLAPRPQLIRAAALSLTLGVLAYGVAWLIAPTYAGFATYYFPLNQARLSPLDSLASGASDGGTVRSLGGALVSPVVASAPQTAVGILESRQLRLEVVRELGLAQQWELSENFAVRRLDAAVTVRMDKNGFLRIEARGASPEEARRILLAYTGQLNRLADRLTLNVSRRNRLFIEERLKDSRRRVREHEESLAAAMVEMGASDPAALKALYLGTRQKLAEIEIESKASSAALASIETSLKRLYEKGKSFPVAALALEDLAKTIGERRIMLEDAKAGFMPGAAELKQAERKAGSAERVADDLISAQRHEVETGANPETAKLRAQLRSLETSAAEYARRLGGLERQMEEEPRRFITLQRAQRELEMALKTNATLESEHQAALIAEARDPGRFELVDEPFADDLPVSPKKGLSALTACVGSFLIQMIVLLFRRVRIPEEPATELPLAA